MYKRQILTYTKAQILKNVLENEGIETYIHNVNQIQPVVSSGFLKPDQERSCHPTLQAHHLDRAQDVFRRFFPQMCIRDSA